MPFQKRTIDLDIPKTAAERIARTSNLKQAFAEHEPLDQGGVVLFWLPTGPLMRYRNGILYVEDLNPEVKTRWLMSRWEMLVLGSRCIIAAVKP